MSDRVAPLIAELKQVFAASVVDEDRAYALLAELIELHGYGKAELADIVGRPRQHLFRILISRQPELAPYRAMCGHQSSVLEEVSGMTEAQRQVLLQQFEQTGRPFSQAMLRRLKREWRSQGTASSVAAPAIVLRTPSPHWQEMQVHDDAFLDLLEKAVKKGQQELQRRSQPR